jgi:hypothetical protein
MLAKWIYANINKDSQMSTIGTKELRDFATVNAECKPLAEANDMLRNSLTDTLCLIIPFSSVFKKSIASKSADIMESEQGRSIVTTIAQVWERTLQFLGTFTGSPMPSIEATFEKDSSKLKDSLKSYSSGIKNKENKPLFSTDELHAAVHQGIKDNVTIASTLSGWSFGLLKKPTSLKIASDVFNNVNSLALAKLVADLPPDQQATPPNEVIEKAAKIAESVSGVKVSKVGKTKDEHEYTPSETYKTGTALNYVSAIYPKDGVTVAANSDVSISPTIPKDINSPATVDRRQLDDAAGRAAAPEPAAGAPAAGKPQAKKSAAPSK